MCKESSDANDVRMQKKAAFTDWMHVAVEDEGFYGSKRFLHSWCCIAFSTSVTVIAIVIVSG